VRQQAVDHFSPVENGRVRREDGIKGWVRRMWLVIRNKSTEPAERQSDPASVPANSGDEFDLSRVHQVVLVEKRDHVRPSFPNPDVHRPARTARVSG
jgi:hypothetical protein